MSTFRSVALAGALLGAAVAFMGCEWSGGSDGDFNTSRAGLDVNISGVYSGLLSGGKAVDPKNGAPVFRLTMFQNGNTIEVTDSNGQQYRGRVGAPGAVFQASATTIPAGVPLASYQVAFNGTDGVAGVEVDFVGVIDVITVDVVEGDETVTEITNGRSNTQTTDTTGGSTTGGESSTTTETTITVTGSDGTGGENTSTDPGSGDVPDTGSAGNTTTEGSQTTTTSTTTTTTTEGSTATAGNNTTENAQTTTRTITTTFLLTEANTQFRLRGNWVEQGGFVGNVEARSTGSGRLVADGTEGVAGEPAVEIDGGN